MRRKWLSTAAAAGTLLVLLSSCATVREKTDAYLMAESPALTRPIAADLRSLEIVSNDLPLSDDYPLLRDSLTAIASRHGFALSTGTDAPYAVDFVLHERSYVVDLATSSSIMAVMNVKPSGGDGSTAARVIYTAVVPDSVQSFYQVNAIAEKLFVALEKALDDRAAKEKAAATAAAP